MTLTAASGRMEVDAIVPDGPCDVEGLVPGTYILAINGVPLGAEFTDEVYAFFRNYDTLTFTVDEEDTRL